MGCFAAHRRAARLSALVLLLAVAAGCGDSPRPPEPTPQPQVRYEVARPTTCSQIDTKAIARQLDLTFQPRREDYRPSYLASPERTYLLCGDNQWVAEDGRFATGIDDLVLSGLFTASGTASITVFPDVAGAQDDYRMTERNYLEPVEVPPSFHAALEQGWWDDGVSQQKVLKLDPNDFTLGGDFNVSRIDVSRALRHRNVVLEAHVDALTPTPETKPVLALLHELAAELLDETIAQLTLTTAPPASSGAG